MPSWFPFSAINSGLMWGSTLIGVPIIIHLLNRRRFRILDWAAMEWLLIAIRRNKRRITIEQLILLALRCLIILLVVLAVSKVFFSSGAAPGVGRFVGSTTDWAVVLDDSYSAGQSVGGAGTCFDRAKRVTGDLLKKIVATHRKDTFALVATETRGHKLPAASKVDREFARRIQSGLEHTGPADLRLGPAGLIERGLIALRGAESSNKALVIATDCRRADWTFAEAQRAELEKQLAEAKDLGVRIYLADCGPADPRDFANLAVVGLAPREKITQAGAIAELTATVRNLGPADASDLPVTFTVRSPVYGANPQPTKTIEKIAAGGEAKVTLFYTFKTAGSYSVTAEIGGDPLPVDNVRSLALDVSGGVNVLLVDGEPALDRTESETYTLRHALSPTVARFGVNVKVIDAAALTAAHVDRSAVVILANVARLAPAQIEMLGRFVRRGGGLAIFPGDRVEPAAFGRLFYDGGKGIAPCELESAVGDPAAAARTGGKFVRLSSAHVGHPVMADFRDELAVLVGGARFYRRFLLKLPADLEKSGLTAVARYDDAGRSVAMVEKQIGKGTVVLGTSSADAEWNTWPKMRTYPVVMHRLVEHLHTRAGGTRNLTVGARYTLPVDLSRFDLDVTVDPPKRGGALRRAAQVGADGAAVVTIDETRSAGVYTVKLKSRSAAEAEPSRKGLNVEYFAATLDTRESDLRRVDMPSFKNRLAELGITYGATADDIWQNAPEERVNLWRVVLIALGCCLALESFLGWKFGHHKT